MSKNFDLVNDAFLWAWHFAAKYIENELEENENLPRYGITDFERDIFIEYTHQFLLMNNYVVKGIAKSEFNRLQQKYPDCSKREIRFNLMYRVELSNILYDAISIAVENKLAYVTINELLNALLFLKDFEFSKMPFNALFTAIRMELSNSPYHMCNMSTKNGHYIS